MAQTVRPRLVVCDQNYTYMKKKKKKKNQKGKNIKQKWQKLRD
jgi:hypothetical protein